MTDERARQLTDALPDWCRLFIARAMEVDAGYVAIAAGLGAAEACELLSCLYAARAELCRVKEGGEDAC